MDQTRGPFSSTRRKALYARLVVVDAEEADAVEEAKDDEGDDPATAEAAAAAATLPAPPGSSGDASGGGGGGGEGEGGGGGGGGEGSSSSFAGSSILPAHPPELAVLRGLYDPEHAAAPAALWALLRELTPKHVCVRERAVGCWNGRGFSRAVGGEGGAFPAPHATSAVPADAHARAPRRTRAAAPLLCLLRTAGGR